MSDSKPETLPREAQPNRRREAMRAPSTSDCSFAHTTVGWISVDPAKEAKPQSAPAMTRSRPTTLAKL